MKFEKKEKLLNFIKENPNITNQELADLTGRSIGAIKTALSRYIGCGLITDVDDCGARHLVVNDIEAMEFDDNKPKTIEQEKFELKRDEKLYRRNITEYKRRIYDEMVTTILEDFRQANTFEEREPISKILMRMLESL